MKAPVPSRSGRSSRPAAALLAAALLLPACADTPIVEPDARPTVLDWNQIAVDASGLDHTPVAPGEVRTFGEQLGPGRASRAMAIVHVAMFEALNASAGHRYPSYIGLPAAPNNTSIRAAIAQAAHTTLVALYPSQAPRLDALLAADLALLPESARKVNGIGVGKRAATAILVLRENDGSRHPEPRFGVDYWPSPAPGKWRQDPIRHNPVALGAHWGSVQPFVLPSGDHFRSPAPPALDSPAYAAAYNEVKQMGGDDAHTPSARDHDQTDMGTYWAYDGTPALCAPTRLYNQITAQIATQQGLDAVELSRLLALANVAMADAAIAIWDSKYAHEFWRPVTGIREADPGTGPSGAGDGNPDTAGDRRWTPMGAPASNLGGPNFTPPFPAYPSGHAGFGGALFQVLRRTFGRDDISFTFVSDEMNGVTRDTTGQVRPMAPRSFTSFSQAEEENGQSRIYLGIHWSFDKTEGIALGRRVGDHTLDHLYRPR